MFGASELQKIEKLEAKKKSDKLLKYLKSSDVEIMTAAMNALARIGDEDGVNSVMKLIDAEDINVRRAAITASAHIGSQYVKSLLQHRMARETDEETKKLLMDALQKFSVV